MGSKSLKASIKFDILNYFSLNLIFKTTFLFKILRNVLFLSKLQTYHFNNIYTTITDKQFHCLGFLCASQIHLILFGHIRFLLPIYPCRLSLLFILAFISAHELVHDVCTVTTAYLS